MINPIANRHDHILQPCYAKLNFPVAVGTFQKASGLNDFEKAEDGSFGENDGRNGARADYMLEF